MSVIKIVSMEEAFPIKDIVVGRRAREDYGDIEGLTANVKEKGIIQPILLNQKHELIAGERRYRAASAAKMTTMPVVIAKITGEIDALELELIENRWRKDMHWSEETRLEKQIHEHLLKTRKQWDQSKTAAFLGISKGELSKRLQLADYLDLAPEIKEFENSSSAVKALERIVADHLAKGEAAQILYEDDGEGSEAPAAVEGKPKKATAATKKKVLAALGKDAQWLLDAYHRGDALEKTAKVRAGSYHFAEVDPPYAIDLADKRKRTKDKHQLGEYEEISPSEYPEFIETMANSVYRALRPDAFCVWWYGPEWYQTVYTALINAGFKVNKVPALWYKGPVGQVTNPDYNLANSYEPFFVARKGRVMLRERGRSNVFHYDGVAISQRIHPTQRPLDLLREIIRHMCPENGHMIVPFLGSGSTLMAAWLENRKGTGWDLNENTRNHFVKWVAEEAEKYKQGDK